MTGAIILLALAALAFGPRLLRWKAQAARASVLETARLIQEPILIRSEHPADATVNDRAHLIKTLIAESGNTWITPADVHVRVYHPNMGNGKEVRLTFAHWRQLVENEYDGIMRKFAIENQTINTEINAALYGQNGKSN